jgi:RND family efflux transporter MFP subunit
MKVDVSENLIKYFVVGETMDINVKSAGDTILSGKVKEILPPSQGSLTYPVEILVSNPPSEVKAGMFAEINIATESRNQVIAVPSEAVVVKEGNTIVYIIEKDKAKLVSVKTGLDNGKMVEITEGLNEGMEVVVKGQNFLEDGALVSVVKQEE